MKLTYDPTADAAYIYFSNKEPEGSLQSVPVEWIMGIVVLDLTEDGRIFWMEILDASLKLEKELLDQAKTE